MSISVRELVEIPHMRIEVLGGSSGLDRRITWAHSSDLDEPWAWLSGGELLMKNGRTLPRDEAEQILFVEGLGAARVSALVVGSDPESPPLAEAALERAEELHLPLLRVPYSMSFIVLSRTVADAAVDEGTARLARTERIYHTINAAVAGHDSGVFLQRLSAELGCRLFVVDAETLEPVLEGTSRLSVPTHRGLLEEIERHGAALPGTLRLRSPRSRDVLAVEIPYEEPTYLVAEFAPGQVADVLLLQHAATAVAVQIAHESLRADHRRQMGGELLARLVDHAVEPASGAARLKEFAIAPEHARLLALSGLDAAHERSLLVGLLRRRVPHLLWRREGTLFALLCPCEESTALLDRLTTTALVGESAPLRDVSRVPSAMREALWALAGAGRDQPRVAYEASAPLPALHSPEEAEALVARVLGPLIDYDAAHGTELFDTLVAFLGAQRSWQRCAEQLDVHRQTVIYRMRRVEQLTSRNLADTSDLAVLWLAVAAHEVLQPDEPSRTRPR